MKSWYAYVEGDPLNADNYYLASVPPPYKGVGTKICAVYVKDSGVRPSQFTKKIRTLITNALITGEPQSIAPHELTVVLKR